MSILDQFRKHMGKAESDEDLVKHHLAKGEQMLNSQFYDRAMIEFNKALKINKELAGEALADIYREVQAGGDSEAIIAIGSNLLMQDSKNAELANLLGNAYRKSGDLQNAIKLYKHSAKIQPSFKSAHYNLAAAAAKVDLYDSSAVSAIQEFEELSQYKLPDNKEGEERLMEIQMEIRASQSQEEPSESDSSSDEDWQEKLKEDTKNVKEEEEPPVEIDPKAILQHIQQKIGLESDEAQELFYILGIYCLENQHPDYARKLFGRLSLKTPDDNLRCYLALTLDAKGATEKAIDLLMAILNKTPRHRYSNVNLGYLYQKQRKRFLSRKYYFITQKLLEASQGFYDIREAIALGNKHVSNGRLKKAMEVFTPLLDEIDSVELLNKIGGNGLELGHYDTSLKAFRKVLHIDPENKEARTSLGQANDYFMKQANSCIKQKKWEEAAKMLESSLEIIPAVNVVAKIIDVYGQLEDVAKVRYWEKKMKEIEESEVKRRQDRKLKEARMFQEQRKFKSALRSYEEALKIKPERSIFLLLVGVCDQLQRPDLVAEFTKMFNQLQEEQKKANLNQNEVVEETS